jgi:hypothetical protein
VRKTTTRRSNDGVKLVLNEPSDAMSVGGDFSAA